MDEYTEKAVLVVHRNLPELIDRLCFGHVFTASCFMPPLMGNRMNGTVQMLFSKGFADCDVRVRSIIRRK